MKRAVLLAMALLVGCRQEAAKVAPRTCGALCSTNNDCSDFFSGCRVCWRARCSTSLPATPTSDAGIDAPTQ